MSKIKVVIIDPFLQIIREGEIDGDLLSLQKSVGGHNIEIVYLDNDNIMYVDEEGLFREDQQFFIYNKRPFAGQAVVLGDDIKNGDSIACNSTVLEIAKKVEFHTASEISQMGLG